MLRALIVALLLVVAAPAQWLGPTNVYLVGAQSDVFVSGGKVYVIVWSASTSSTTPTIEMWNTPNRMPVLLRMVGLVANDPRPCARQVGHGAPWGGVRADSRLGWNQQQDDGRAVRLRLGPALVVEGRLAFDAHGRSCWLRSEDYRALTKRLQAAGIESGTRLDAEIMTN